MTGCALFLSVFAEELHSRIRVVAPYEAKHTARLLCLLCHWSLAIYIASPSHPLAHGSFRIDSITRDSCRCKRKKKTYNFRRQPPEWRVRMKAYCNMPYVTVHCTCRYVHDMLEKWAATNTRERVIYSLNEIFCLKCNLSFWFFFCSLAFSAISFRQSFLQFAFILLCSPYNACSICVQCFLSRILAFWFMVSRCFVDSFLIKT